jgi:hypothetical protein
MSGLDEEVEVNPVGSSPRVDEGTDAHRVGIIFDGRLLRIPGTIVHGPHLPLGKIFL